MEKPTIPPPHKGTLRGVTGTIVISRLVTCPDCEREIEVAAMMTDAGAVGIITEDEADVEPRH